ncbi:hypothetical protein EG352_12005 [Chryseobacterium indologenes]|uniref:Uncharacterized protein n=1 Tax=Chryseobacterium indologenes TaxID=253 RepID=A0AAD0YWA2_CHRID|nr:hypothetical protein [Chryseobacterium indologenes]AZB18455.1 hypothetical protein EG352_12005 [Chryseobacterium indologenes]
MDSIIEKYIDIQQEILSDFAIRWDGEKCKTSFRDDVKKFYGFEKKFGWNIILNSYYVINDTELAKASFNKFGLQGPSRHTDIGERYLRLYGLLNSVYQQKIAMDNLMEVFKLTNYKKLSKELAECNLITLRNKIASHPSNYMDIQTDSEHKFDVYEISRPDLQIDKITLLRNQNHFENFDLVNTIKEFDNKVEDILQLITEKIIKKIFNNQGKHYEEFIKVNLIRDGAIISGDTIITFIKNS